MKSAKQEGHLTAGLRGEEQVGRTIAALPGCVLLHDVYIPYRGGSAQIDFVLVSSGRLFVIECKRYAGTITGSASRYEWTQTLKQGRRRVPLRRKLYNPVKQSLRHVEILARYAKLSRTHIHAVIVFTGSCTLKKIPANTDQFTIVREEYLRSTIERLMSRKQEQPLSAEKRQEVTARLQALPHPSVEEQVRHNVRAREAQRVRQQKRR